jgi:L-iditol 2-dehydrogenase
LKTLPPLPEPLPPLPPVPARAADLPATRRSAVLLGPERLEVREAPVPRPGPGEILVAIGAATTCGTDVKVFRRGGHPRMLRVPSPFGHEMAGTVAAAGPGAPFHEGERVAIANSVPCGRCRACRRGHENLCSDLLYLNGAFAEYLLVPARFVERSVYRCPAGLPFELAALAEPLACVLHGVETMEGSGLAEGPSEIALFGSGPIGLLFVDLLTHRGHRVVAVDPNPQRLAAARALGAAATVEVGRDGGEAARVRAASSIGETVGFDVVIEASGSPTAWEDAVESVAPGGLVLLFGGYPPATAVPLNAHRLHYGELTVKGAYHHRPATFARALELLAAGALAAPRALLSAELPLDRLEDALRSMMRREALKVVIRP